MEFDKHILQRTGWILDSFDFPNSGSFYVPK